MSMTVGGRSHSQVVTFTNVIGRPPSSLIVAPPSSWMCPNRCA